MKVDGGTKVEDGGGGKVEVDGLEVGRIESQTAKFSKSWFFAMFKKQAFGSAFSDLRSKVPILFFSMFNVYMQPYGLWQTWASLDIARLFARQLFISTLSCRN